MTRAGSFISVLMKRYAEGLKQSWLQKYWRLKRCKGRLAALFHSWQVQRCTLKIEYCIAYRTWGYAEPLSRCAMTYLPCLMTGWTWGNVETVHWSKGKERVRSGKICSSYMGRWSISVIMILPGCRKSAIRSIWMTVQDRCGQCSDLPPVLQFFIC